jgi:hypothetical protein
MIAVILVNLFTATSTFSSLVQEFLTFLSHMLLLVFAALICLTLPPYAFTGVVFLSGMHHS